VNLLIIDTEGTGLDLAIRSQAAGHKVRLYIRHNKDGSRCENGDGIIQRVPHWEDHMNWADLIFCTDNNWYVYPLERYRDQGYPILGPSIDAAEWEQNREVGAEVHEKVGVPIIPMKKFSNYDEAIAYVLKNPQRYVSKPIGDGAKDMSYVSKNAADMVYMLQYWKKKNSYKGEFVIQDFVKGNEFGVGGWFGAGGFSQWWCESWEHKKLMNDELGVNTGEMGTIIRYTQKSKLADEVLKPCEGMLHGLGYTGYVDVNCIIDGRGTAWPLEWTMRPGWPLFNIQNALHKGDPIEWMLDLINGKDTLRVSEDVACGVVISIPDFPYSRLTKKECSGYPLFDLTLEDALKDIHLSEVQWGKAPHMEGDKVKLNVPMYVTAGDYVCVVTGTGETVEESRDKCYSTIKRKIEIPNSVAYRTDIGKKLEDQLPEIQKHGYAKGVRY
jgi:phosphoribosylamine--glycine ligase